MLSEILLFGALVIGSVIALVLIYILFNLIFRR
jgi:hypothetical protein